MEFLQLPTRQQLGRDPHGVASARIASCDDTGGRRWFYLSVKKKCGVYAWKNVYKETPQNINSGIALRIERGEILAK